MQHGPVCDRMGPFNHDRSLWNCFGPYEIVWLVCNPTHVISHKTVWDHMEYRMDLFGTVPACSKLLKRVGSCGRVPLALWEKIVDVMASTRKIAIAQV